SVLAAGYASGIEPVLRTLPDPAREPVADSLAAALEVAESSGPAGSQLAETATAAFVEGYSQGAIVLSIVTVAGALVLAVWSPGRSARVRTG
ncbi:MAG: MFS transporter, partial [Mycobacterium sp.]